LTSTDRIEVLRGPIAQLYGNSAGGVIQAFTRGAPDQPELQVQGYIGSYGTNRTDWQYAQKVGQFGLVADYSTFKTDGFRQYSQTERNQFNGKVTYDHNESNRVTFIANIFDMPYAYDPKGLKWSDFQSNPSLSPNSKSYYNKSIKQEQFGVTLDHRYGADAFIKSYVYSGHRENTHINAPTTFVGLDRDYGGLGFDYVKKDILFSRQATYSIGMNYDSSKELNYKGTHANGVISNLYSGRKEDRTAENKDFYAAVNALTSDKTSITTGFRYTNVKINLKNVSPTSAAYSGELNATAINPVAGLTYHYADNLNIFANYGRGFETPTLGELSSINVFTGSTITGVTSGWNSSLHPSKSNHYELGLKWLPLSTARVDASLFYIKTQNEILVDYGDSVNPSFKNVGGTTRKGFEVAGQAMLLKSLRGLISASYLDATFDETSLSANNTFGSVQSGYKLPGIPQGQLFTQLTWSLDDFKKNKQNKVLGTVFTAEWSANGRVYVADNNSYVGTYQKSYAPGYSLYNLKASHRWEVNQFTLTTLAQLNNLTDKKYIGSVIVGDTSAPFESAPGRNWMLGLNATTRF
jgi:iron complex outermembrane receptor protein